MTYMISSTYLNWLAAHYTLSYILALRCEYRKSINDDVIDWYNDMLIEAISIWEGGRVIPPTMLEKLRHDVAVATSRRNNNYVPTQWQLHRDAVSGASCPLSSKALLKFERAFFESKVSLTSIFGDKKTKKGLYWTQKPSFCSVDAPSAQWIEKNKKQTRNTWISANYACFNIHRVWQ